MSERKMREEEEGGIALRVGGQGRIIVPPSVLREKGISEGDIVWVYIERAEVILPKKKKNRR